MAILTMKSTVNSGKYGKKVVADLVNTKGVIISLIKEGYEFDDEVLNAAHITRQVSNVNEYYSVTKDKTCDHLKPLRKETTPIKQILSEINTLNTPGNDNANEKDGDFNFMGDVDNYSEEDD